MYLASLVAQTVNNMPAMQEIQVQSLAQEDPLEKSGNPLQYSCLENPMDRGVWWVTVQGLTKSWTCLLSLAEVRRIGKGKILYIWSNKEDRKFNGIQEICEREGQLTNTDALLPKCRTVIRTKLPSQ